MASQPANQEEAPTAPPVETITPVEYSQQEATNSSSPTSDRQHSLSSRTENSESGSTAHSDDQISPAPTNTTLVPPNGNVSPLLKDTPFRVDVKRLGSEAESITSVTPSADSQNTPIPKSSHLRDVETVQHNEKKSAREKTKRLKIHWGSSSDDTQPSIYGYYPASMILLALGGFFGALGHHLYNQHLDGQEVNDAAWPQRWGIALAFFIKMMLAAAVQVAFKQIAWLTVKKRAFRIRTLDSIFHVCYDPVEFLDKDLLRGAFLPTLLATLIWLLPLSAIATPSTLTLADGIKSYVGTCPVSHLDFRMEIGSDMNNWDKALDKNPLSFWDQFPNSTSYYNSPSMDLRRIFLLAQLSTSPIQPDRSWSADPVYVNPLQQDNPCPKNSDCSFSVSFSAPSYKCEERQEFGGQRLFNRSDLAPYGDLIYVSYSSIPEDDGGRPLDWNTQNPNNDTGVFKEEPSLWIGYTWNTTKPITAENTTQWNTSYWQYAQYDAHILECTLQNATYHITLAFVDSMQQVKAYSIEYGPPLLPAGQEMRPGFDPTYEEFAGFHGSGFMYRNLLAGNISQPGDFDYVWASTYSDITETDIIDPGNGLPHEENLAKYIEAGFQAVYLAMLSDKKQASQFFQDTPCDIQAKVLVWKYTPLWLAISYCIAVSLTLLAVGVGLYAMAKNGYVARTTFSTFLATTRNMELDGVDWGSSLGTLPLKKEVSETILRFGETAQAGIATGNDAVPHAAFGFPEGIRTIRRGQQYE